MLETILATIKTRCASIWLCSKGIPLGPANVGFGAPNLMRKDVLKITERLQQKYPGRYVAVINGRVIAAGRSQLSVFKKAEKGFVKNKEVGIFYIPSKTALPLLLKVG